MSGELSIVGLGPGRYEQVTLEAAEVLIAAARNTNARVYAFSPLIPLATRIAPALQVLTLDDRLIGHCERHAAYDAIIDELFCEASQEGRDVLYLTAGSPLVINDFVILLRQAARRHRQPLRIVHGLSFFDVVLDRVFWHSDPGLQLLTAWSVARGDDVLSPHLPALLYELGEGGDEAILDALTERLLAIYPAAHPVALLFSSGAPNHASCSRRVVVAEMTRQNMPRLCNLWVPALAHGATDPVSTLL